MPELDIQGTKRKVACGPCIRGHRSSKCEHKDRVLVEVRKPGRPLSACPHPPGSCNCDQIVLNYTIPKSNRCVCKPPENTVKGGPSARVTKAKAQRPPSSIVLSNIENGLKRDRRAVLDSVESGAADMVPDDPSGKSCCGEPSVAMPPEAPMKELPDTPVHSNGTLRSSTVESRQLETDSSALSTGGAIRSCCCPDISSLQAEASGRSDAASQHNEQTEEENTASIAPPVATRRRSSMQPPNGFEISSGCVEQQAETTFAAQQQDSLINSAKTSFDHNCTCGDDCTCFGCPMHPKNKPTIDYVRYYSGMVENDSITSVNSTYETAQPPRSQWHLENIPEISVQWPSSTPDRTVAQDLAYRHLAAQQQSGTQNTTTQIHSSIDESRPFRKTAELDFHDQGPESMAFDTDSPSSGEEAPKTLDSVPFFIHQYTFSPHSGPARICQCRDGYNCPGCLIQKSHFSPLPPTPPIQPAVTDYIDNGTSCACHPFPKPAGRAQDLQHPFRSTTSQPRTTAGKHTPAIPSPPTPTTGLGNISDITCTCPSGTKILAMTRAQAQVQVHAQLHGWDCDCRMGWRYFQTLSEAEAAAHQRPSSQSAGWNSVFGWEQVVGMPSHLPG